MFAIVICLVLVMCTLTILDECMSVVVNVMLFLMSVMSPPPALCNLSARTVVKYAGCVCFRGELGFLECDDICMCVVNKQLKLLELVLIPFMFSYSMMRFISLLLLGLCPCGVSVVMWSSLVCLLSCRGTLCGCDGCCDCDACTVVCVACVYAERV